MGHRRLLRWRPALQELPIQGRILHNKDRCACDCTGSIQCVLAVTCSCVFLISPVAVLVNILFALKTVISSLSALYFLGPVTQYFSICFSEDSLITTPDSDSNKLFSWSYSAICSHKRILE